MLNDLSVELAEGKIDLSLPARIQVSMHNPFCTGKYLFALSEWVRRQGFTSIDYQVSDTLQRHNYIWRDSLQIENARAQAIETGERWLTQNSAVIQLCYQAYDRVSVSRWDFWIRHPEFRGEEEFFWRLFKSDDGFRNAIDQEVEKYFSKAGRTLNKQRRELSRKFLIEETAVSEVSSKHYPANEIYPGPRFGPEQYLIAQGIDGVSMKEESFIHLQFVDT